MIMPESLNLDEKNARNIEVIRNFTLLDDTFMTQVFSENLPATQMLLRTVLQRNDMIVERSVTQLMLANLYGRSVRLDIYARDAAGMQYDIEVQGENDGAAPERARLNSALFDSRLTSPGQKFKELPETYVVFITRNDVLGGGRPVYTIERTIRETGQLFQDRAHIVYVNGAWRGDDAVGQLMHDFSCKDYRDMYNKDLASIVRHYKEEPEGVVKMCKIMQDIVDSEVSAAVTATRMEIALTLWDGGEKDMNLIAEKTKLTVDQVRDAILSKTA